MNESTEQLINNALKNLNSSQGDVTSAEFADRLTQLSIAYSLIAIAQSLYWMNTNKEREMEREDRLKEISW